MQISLVTAASFELKMKFADLVAQHKDLETTLDGLSNSLDQTAIGAYLQDKMGLLLSSNAICNAYKRCTTGERKELDKNYLREVFPNMNNNNSRSSKQWYDKAKSQGASK